MVVEHVGQPVGIEDGAARQDAVLAVGDEVDLRRRAAASRPSSSPPRSRSRAGCVAAVDPSSSGSVRPGSTVADIARKYGAALASRDHAAPTATAHRPTLMTVHAHPDDETIGTGGSMAKAVADGHRVVLVTCTRGEMGEIVVPEMDTPDNHRRLGEMRAGELERAMGRLGVTEWENLGYHDSDMMGRPGNRDPRSLLAGRPRRGRPAAGLADPALPARRHHDLQRRSAATAIRTTSGPTTSRSGRSRGPAIRPGTRSSSRPSTAARVPAPTRAGSRRGHRRSSTSRPSRRPSGSGWRRH